MESSPEDATQVAEPYTEAEKNSVEGAQRAAIQASVPSPFIPTTAFASADRANTQKPVQGEAGSLQTKTSNVEATGTEHKNLFSGILSKFKGIKKP